MFNLQAIGEGAPPWNSFRALHIFVSQYKEIGSRIDDIVSSPGHLAILQDGSTLLYLLDAVPLSMRGSSLEHSAALRTLLSSPSSEARKQLESGAASGAGSVLVVSSASPFIRVFFHSTLNPHTNQQQLYLFAITRSGRVRTLLPFFLCHLGMLRFLILCSSCVCMYGRVTCGCW